MSLRLLSWIIVGAMSLLVIIYWLYSSYLDREIRKVLEKLESINNPLKKYKPEKWCPIPKSESSESKPRRHLVMLTADQLLNIIEKDPSKPLSYWQDEIVKKGQIIGSVPGDMDGDLLTGELRDQGFKIKNINEEIRKEKRKDNEKNEN